MLSRIVLDEHNNHVLMLFEAIMGDSLIIIMMSLIRLNEAHYVICMENGSMLTKSSLMLMLLKYMF